MNVLGGEVPGGVAGIKRGISAENLASSVVWCRRARSRQENRYKSQNRIIIFGQWICYSSLGMCIGISVAVGTPPVAYEPSPSVELADGSSRDVNEVQARV